MDFEASAPTICQDADGSIQLDKTSQENIYAFLVNDQLISTQNGEDGSMSVIIPAQQLNMGNNNIEILATPVGGCGSPVSKTYSLMVDARVTPQSATAASICREGQATLSATGASAGQEYHWYAAASDNTVLSSGARFTTPVLAKNATYYVAIQNATGCEGDRVPATVQVIHYDNPQIMSAADSLYITSTGTQQWYLDGVALPNDTLASIRPLQSGVYSVNVAMGTCVATAMATYEKPQVVTGTVPETASALRVYPNPVHGYLHFESQDASINQVHIQNASGQTLGTIKLQHGSGKIDMSSFAGGLYLIQVECGDGTKEVKIIKE
jgi:hypothetical protein